MSADTTDGTAHGSGRGKRPHTPHTAAMRASSSSAEGMRGVGGADDETVREREACGRPVKNTAAGAKETERVKRRHRRCFSLLRGALSTDNCMGVTYTAVLLPLLALLSLGGAALMLGGGSKRRWRSSFLARAMSQLLERRATVPPPPPPSPLRGTLGDADPIHIAITACGNPTDLFSDYWGLLSLKSLLMSKAHAAGAARHYVFHILTNVRAAELFNTSRLNHEVYRAMRREEAAGLISVHVHHIDALDAATEATLHSGDPNRAVPHHVFKSCVASRLKLPFLLARMNISRVLYLDWDVVVLCDLTQLWDEWHTPAVAENPSAILGFVPNDLSGTLHIDSLHPKHSSVNTGVMFMNVARMAAADGRLMRAFWDTTAAVIARHVNVTGNGEVDYWSLTKAFPLGDQDILNEVLTPISALDGHPEWVFFLPRAYNWCIDPPFLEDPGGHTTAMRQGEPVRPPPCILHFCGNKLFPAYREGRPLRDVQALPHEDPLQAAFIFYTFVPLEKPVELLSRGAPLSRARGARGSQKRQPCLVIGGWRQRGCDVYRRGRGGEPVRPAVARLCFQCSAYESGSR